MPIFVVAVFFSAFLLFSVQPMVAKAILPSFGGTAAVWATCMVVFQTLLLAGYAYAHLLRVKLSPIQQRWTHMAVLAVALLFLPPVPNVDAAAAVAHPVWELIRSVMTSIGVPFFALAATAPLLMEWFRQTFPGRPPDRLYAFSNAGSLLALFSYPALIERGLGIKVQAACWAGGMVMFLIICGVTAWQSDKQRRVVTFHPTISPNVLEKRRASPRSSVHGREEVMAPTWLWVAQSACGSALLLALTNQITQDVAPMPLLWVAPLGVYLLTFILCFESTRFYRRWLFMPACFATLLLLAWLLQEGYLQGFWTQVGGYLTVLFCGCMLCHGELYRLRPPAECLTKFYLSLSLGGALGGVFIALVAPILFDTLLEAPLLAAIIPALSTYILWNESKPPNANAKRSTRRFLPWQAALIGTGLTIVAHGYAQSNLRERSIHFARSFYGVYRVTEGPQLLLDNKYYPLSHGRARVLHSGQIYHGLQFTAPEAAMIATTYYSEKGGLGLAFRNLPVLTNRMIGAIGLGAGTLATYARVGDRIRFYELSPQVVQVANTFFTFLTNCPAKLDVVIGDARISLEHEAPQGFDLLVLDAFSGDSVPVHLLTLEAMKIYLRHLKSTGVMAFHISNSHLDLAPVVCALANAYNLGIVLVPATQTDVQSGKLPSVWALLSANPIFLRQPEVREVLNTVDRTSGLEPRPPLLWTDDHSSILPILQ